MIKFVPGELAQVGTVVQRGKTPAAAVLVEWENGRREKVRPRDPQVRFAHQGSRRLQWLMDPDSIHEDFQADAAGVFAHVIQEAGKITALMLARRLGELGLIENDVKDALAKSKDELIRHPNIVRSGQTYTWSDEPKPVPPDPLADLRRLPPHDALDRLAFGKGLRAPEKAALAEAIRVALPRPVSERQMRH